jgi:hypothetical protein
MQNILTPKHNAPWGEDEAARFDIANRLFLRLYQASNLMHKTGTRAVAGFGATTQQWAVMGALARPASREAGLTVKELIAFLLVSRQNLTAVIDRLVAAGLVPQAPRTPEQINALIRSDFEKYRAAIQAGNITVD